MSISKFISIILHPIFMPLIAFYLSLSFMPNIGVPTNELLTITYLIIIISTIILPLVSIAILIRNGSLSSLEMSNHKERSLPLIYALTWMILGYYLLSRILIYIPLLRAEILAAIIIIAAAAIISKFWKVSLHMLGIGGLVGVFIALQLLIGGLINIILISILVSGILGSARLHQKAHNHAQIYVGFLLGISIALFTILFF